MNNLELAQKYVNKYLAEEEKWNFILSLLAKLNTVKTKEEIYNILQIELKEFSKAQMCKFIKDLNELPIDAKIFMPITCNEHFYGGIALYSSEENFYEENNHWVKVICENVGLMIENINLIESLMRSNQQKMDFLAGVSHEFKTPLNAIMGFTEVLKGRVSNEENYKYLDNISQSSMFLMQLIQSILDVTRSVYKPLEAFKEVFRPQVIITQVLSELENDIKKKNVKISTTFLDMTINADIRRFRQLIYNLVSNAIKFNKENGKITILTYKENNQFVFEITDEGDGISKKDYDKIFGIFTQVNKDSFKRQLGSGIGLALCKTIIDAHKGSIGFETKLHKGTTFWFKLPLL